MQNWALDLMTDESFRKISIPMSRYLRTLCQFPKIHGRFLNTLSYIENNGSRYLLLSHNPTTTTQVVLKHIVEEARHAFALRKMAEKVAGEPLTYTDSSMISQKSAKMYFARLVASITRDCRKISDGVVLPYLYISGAIEIRALWLYTMYDEILRQENVGVNFAGILAEEMKHIESICQHLKNLDPHHRERMSDFVKLESQLFSRFFVRVVERTTRFVELPVNTTDFIHA